MAEIWFEVSLRFGRIDKVEVEKHTPKSVWVKRGYNYVKMHPREDAYNGFYPTFEGAKAVAEEHQTNRLRAANKEVEDAMSRHARVVLMKESELADPPKYDTPLFLGNIKL